MKIQMVPTFPGQVAAGNGVSVAKSNGIWTIANTHTYAGSKGISITPSGSAYAFAIAEDNATYAIFVGRDNAIAGTLLQMQFGKAGPNQYQLTSVSTSVISLQTIGHTGLDSVSRVLIGLAIDTRISAGKKGSALGANIEARAEQQWQFDGGPGGATGAFIKGIIDGVGGDVFGLNTYAISNAGLAANQVVGYELDVLCVSGTTAKKGLQIVEMTGSNGAVSNPQSNVAIHILSQAEPVGKWQFGILIDDGNGSAVFPLRADASIIKVRSGTVFEGISLAQVIISGGNAMVIPNATWYAALNAAGNANLKVIGVDSNNRVSLYNGAALLYAGGAFALPTAGSTLAVGAASPAAGRIAELSTASSTIMRMTGAATANNGALCEFSDGTNFHSIGHRSVAIGDNDHGMILYIGGTSQNLYIFNGAAVKVTIGNGIIVGAATGGDKGNGTINVSGDIYKNNTAYTNPDYVLEHYVTGRIQKFADRARAHDYDGPMPLDELDRYIQKNLRLPRVDDEPAGMFERADIGLEKIEELFIHLIAANKRIAVLESATHH